MTRQRIRLAADAAVFDGPIDLRREAIPAFWRGNDIQFEIALFDDGVLADIGGLASLTVEVKAAGKHGVAPDANSATLMSGTLSSGDLNAALDEADWEAGDDEHAVMVFTGAESAIEAGDRWLIVRGLTADSPGRQVTFAAGLIRVVEDGGSAGDPPAEAPEGYYSDAESDARFLGKSTNLSDLETVSEARENLGLGSLATMAEGDLDKLSESEIRTLHGAQQFSGGAVFAASGYIEVADSDELTLPDDRFSIELIFLADDVTSERVLFSKMSGTNIDGEYGISVDDGQLIISCQETGNGSARDKYRTPIVAGRFYHAVFTYDGTNRQWYIDAKAAATSVVSGLNTFGGFTNTTTPLRVGGAPIGALRGFKGIVTRARLWNRVLTADQVDSLSKRGPIPGTDQWASRTNEYGTSGLNANKNIYLEIAGSEAITIDGQLYNSDGSSGGIDASAGIVFEVNNGVIASNSLTSASTLEYAGCLFDLALSEWGAPYVVRDLAHGLVGLASATGTYATTPNDPLPASPATQFNATWTVSASGFMGGSSRAILPAGHIITAIAVNTLSAVTVTLKTDSGGATIWTGSVNGTRVLSPSELSTWASPDGLVYVDLSSSVGTTVTIIGSIA